jgi:NAD(P)-dependent dehydrogenase (short-subunit alcohol dehydrogenase family)
MSQTKTSHETRRTVLITGCSANGLGHALAVAFHNAGLRVFATARNTSKMADLKELGIECLQLDVLDQESIERCVGNVRRLTGKAGGEGRLDCLVNNAGGGELICIFFLVLVFLLSRGWRITGSLFVACARGCGRSLSRGYGVCFSENEPRFLACL